MQILVFIGIFLLLIYLAFENNKIIKEKITEIIKFIVMFSVCVLCIVMLFNILTIELTPINWIIILLVLIFIIILTILIHLYKK